MPTVATVAERFELTAQDLHPPRSGFSLTCREADRWDLAGELDCDSAPMLVPTAEATLPRPPVLVLECPDLEFIDVAGWRALRTVRLLLEPATELRLCHPSGALRRLMIVLGQP